MIKIATIPLTFAVDVGVGIAHGAIAYSKGINLRTAVYFTEVKLMCATRSIAPLVKMVLIAFTIKYIWVFGFPQLVNLAKYISEIRKQSSSIMNILREFSYHVLFRLLILGMNLATFVLINIALKQLNALIVSIADPFTEQDQTHTVMLNGQNLRSLKIGKRAIFDEQSIRLMQELPTRIYSTVNVAELIRLNERVSALTKKVDDLNLHLAVQNVKATLGRNGFFSNLVGYSCQSQLDRTEFDNQRLLLRNRIRELSANGQDLTQYWAKVEECQRQISSLPKDVQNLHPYDNLKKIVYLGVSSPRELLNAAYPVNFNKFLDNKLNPEAKALFELVEWTSNSLIAQQYI